MDSQEDGLLQLAGAVADGTAIDWAHAESSAEAGAERDVIRQLRQLASVRAAARAQAAAWGALEIRGEVGKGSFGTVYRAWDTRLEREVALKLLDAGRAASSATTVIKEGRLLAQIRHPNVVTVYGADAVEGRVGLWMEFVTGRTLKEILQDHGPFGAHEAAVVGRDLCRALAAVHKAGFVHRDIKAQNVMREAGGRTVLMDFGAGEAASAVDSSPLSGTPAYLAPEVLAGGAPSVRSDLYSLGVLLYFLVSGEFPVTGGSLDELRAKHAAGRRTPLRDVRPDLPSAFLRAVERATAPDPGDRPETAGAMAALLDAALDLERAEGLAADAPVPRPSTPARTLSRRMVLAGAAAAVMLVTAIVFVATSGVLSGPPAVRSIAVAPFEVGTSAADWRALASALAGDLASALDGPGLLVKGQEFPAQQGTDAVTLAEQMGVDAVVQGSVRVEDERLSVDVGLIQAKSGRELWRRSYERSTADAASLPRLIAADLAESLELSDRRSESAGQAVDLVAYGHYARARELAEERTSEALSRASEQLEAAITQQPDYAAAWAALADVWIARGAFGIVPPREVGAKAREAALRALDLDPQLADAHTSLAFLAYFHDWNWAAADERFKRAVMLNPNYAVAHHWYADFLTTQGRFDEAGAHIETAVSLEPLSVLFRRDIAWHQFFERRYGEAVQHLRAMLDRTPGYGPARSLLGRALIQQGLFDEGIAELRRLDLNAPVNLAMLGYGFAAAGRHDEAREVLTRLRATAYASRYSIALIYTALGEHARAVDELLRAYADQDQTLVNVSVDPRLDALRGDPRFRELITRMGFPDRIR
jgi:TolB-like protein/Flp pilus assembly protein TadD